MWYEGDTPSCYVAPISRYTKEEFEQECRHDADGYFEFGETKEDHARWYPIAPEGIDREGGTYGFGQPGRGAVAVWVKYVKPKKGEA
jgi:hypothetical protein